MILIIFIKSYTKYTDEIQSTGKTQTKPPEERGSVYRICVCVIISQNILNLKTGISYFIPFNFLRAIYKIVLAPLITVSLCATGELAGSGRSRHVLISQVRSVHNISDLHTPPGKCPSHGCFGDLTDLKSRVKRSKTPESSTFTTKFNGTTEKNSTESLPHHPSPLRLEIKSIKNVTRSDLGVTSRLLFDETGRHAPGYLGYPPGHINEDMLVSWICELIWKGVTSYVFVYTAKAFFWYILRYFGLDDTYLETHITLGDEGKHPFEHYGGSNSKGENHGGGLFGKFKGGTHKNYQWHHPATVFYQQPTYQYYKHGKKYELHGYDQHQAVKFAKKYAKKYAKKAKKYGLRPLPVAPYLPAYQRFKPEPKGWGRFKR